MRDAFTCLATGKNWNITFDRITDESARQGDIAESGFILSGASFRDTFHCFQSAREWHYLEASCSEIGESRWIQDNGFHGSSFGDTLSCALHFPENVTPSSRRRIFKLAKAYSTFGLNAGIRAAWVARYPSTNVAPVLQ
jgi:hypothetical protein